MIIPQLPESEWKKILKEIYRLKDANEEIQRKQIKNILDSLNIPLNILIVGGTGVGKSSTINSIYGENKVKIGTGAAPQTQEIEECKISKNITLYDSPGLGEGSEKDKQHMEKIHELLTSKDENGNAKIDLALVIIDASVKGLGQEYETIKYLLKTLGDSKRILIGLNKCDKAISERLFNIENNSLHERQRKFLQEKVSDLIKRIKDDTGLSFTEKDIVYYSAGFYDEEEEKQNKPFNILKLEEMILEKIPKQKRVVQKIEEGQYTQQSTSFFKSVVDFVDVVTDYIPVVKTIKKTGKVIWDVLKSWW